MGKPLVIFGDPIAAALAALRARMPAFDPTPIYGTAVPTTRADGKPARPYVMLALDGVTGRYPVLAVAELRVAVWHTTEARALALAQQVRAVLLTDNGDAAVRGYGEGTGPALTTDPDTHSPLATLTVRARLRPTPLEEHP